MGETIPPVSKSQPATSREEDPHESVTIAPPAPRLEELLRQPTPVPMESPEPELQLALEAGARAGTTLSQLSRMAAELSNGVVGARQANERLVAELSALRGLLAAAGDEQAALRQRALELTQALLDTRDEAERERRFLISQHDEFIASLIDEHEEALARQMSESETRRLGAETSELAQQLVLAETARLRAETESERAREALSRLQAQRDEAQARAERHERERDELRAEASRLRAQLGTHRSASTVPPPGLSPRPPSYRPPPALRLDVGELDVTLHARPVPQPVGLPPRQTPPPEPERAIQPPGVIEETAAEFPRVSTRPGVGNPKSSASPAAASFGPPPSGWTPPPPPPAEAVTVAPPRQRVISAASLPPVSLPSPALKQKPDPSTRPLVDYSLGEDGVKSETLEGVRLSSKPPRKQ